MEKESHGLIIGISIGVVIGVLLAILAFFCFRYHRKRPQIGNSSSRRAATIPIRANGADTCTVLSDSSIGTESPKSTIQNGMSVWLGGLRKANVVSASGILEYSYKYVSMTVCKKCCNFLVRFPIYCSLIVCAKRNEIQQFFHDLLLQSLFKISTYIIIVVSITRSRIR